jgi:hypothetical protein
MLSKSAGLAFLVIAATAMAAGPEPTDLVAQLGSAKYAEREAAASALEKLGAAAFPVLKAARTDPDPEIKNRAEVVLDSIERSMIAKPIRLSFDGRVYTAVELAEILGNSQGVALEVVQGQELVPPARRTIELSRPTELGFWEVADRLGMTLLWEVESRDFGRQMSQTTTTVKLVPKALKPLPTSDFGPFRVVIHGPAHQAREIAGDEPRPRNLGMGFRNAGNMGIGAAETSLVLPMEILAEPRLALRSSGNIRITEAIDDEDQSIAGNLRGELDPANNLNGERSLSTLKVRLRLKSASSTPLRLKSLKGTIPIEIEARRIEPIVIPIPGPGQGEQKPVLCGGTTMQVHGLTKNQFGFAGNFALDLTIRREGWSFVGLGGRRGMGQIWQVVSGDTDRFWDNIEIVDAQGRAYRGGTRRPTAGEGDGIRLQYALDAREGVGQPTHVRFYGGVRTIVEVPFEFQNVKLR